MDPDTTNNNNPNGQRPHDVDEQLFSPRYATPNQPQPNAFPWQQEQAAQNRAQQNRAQAGPASQLPQPAQPATPVAQPLPPSQPQTQPVSQSPVTQPTQWQPGQSVPANIAQYQTPPQTPQAPYQQSQNPGIGPQFGGPMAELPPLAQPTGQSSRQSRQKHKMILIGLAAAVGLALLTVIVLIVVSVMNSNKKVQTVAPIHYVTAQIDSLVKNKQVDAQHIQQLDKTAAFYTAFKNAAVQPSVHTKWDVYYSTNEQDKRGDQFTMYDVAVDYRNKSFGYQEDSNSSIGVIQSRCVEGQQFTYNDSKLSVASGWQPASDSTTCKFGVVATRMNDGVNTAGLTAAQANTFVQKINASQVVQVNGVSVVTPKDVPYLKFDVTVTPRLAAKGIYWGMQNFMTAFQATGLNPQTHPYTYFGTSNEGLHLTYYVDPATQLPVYSQMTSTPGYNAMGKAVTPDSWSHRLIEYEFPAAIVTPTLDDHAPIGFVAWPDH